MKKKKTQPARDDGLDQDVASRSPGRRPSSSRRSSLAFNDKSLTQQQFKSTVDVNNIVAHYAQTGIDPYESRKASLRYGDATSKSFSEAMYQVAEVNSAFHALPAQERAYYNNDPVQWLESSEAAREAPETIISDNQGQPTDPTPNDSQSESESSDAES